MKTIAVAVIALVSLAAGQGTGTITAAQASPFLGEWTISTTSLLGQASYLVTMTPAGNGIQATVKTAGQPDVTVNDIRMSGKSLLLSYSQALAGSPSRPSSS